MTRQDYQSLRRAYRCARRLDSKWHPNPYAARNNIQRHPRHADTLCAGLEPRLVMSLLHPVEHGRGNFRLGRGPRALSLINSRPCAGTCAGLTLFKRVAVRHGIKQMEAIAARRSA